MQRIALGERRLGRAEPAEGGPIRWQHPAAGIGDTQVPALQHVMLEVIELLGAGDRVMDIAAAVEGDPGELYEAEQMDQDSRF